MTAATEVRVPDIGDFSGVPVIEVHVKSGDRVNPEDPLVTLESDKATMDVPSPLAGEVVEVLIKVGDVVSEGAPIAMVQAGDGSLVEPPSLVAQQEPEPDAPAPTATPPTPAIASSTGRVASSTGGVADDLSGIHAGPSVRRTAREFGVDLAAVSGSGPKGRITKDDLLQFLRGPAGAAPAAVAGGSGIPEIPAQDFAQFGPVEIRPLGRIRKLSGPHLHRSWLNVPHVTHNDEADITELDRYRRELDGAAKGEGYRVTLLAFLMKAVVSGLKTFPEFNSSLSPEKDSLILKGYYNVGIAVDTPDGLVVPVFRDVDRKGIIELSRELGETSLRARDGKLKSADLQGGSFTISSLGGIGGTSFTPIVNAPEVAILGVVRSSTKPVWDGAAFVPRLMLPLSLSYDHRVIDGALAARFTRRVCYLLEDDRRLLL
jgi:pyruvate dehydrogenase E2 component (dihydrolipoamide acetyltransferase)